MGEIIIRVGGKKVVKPVVTPNHIKTFKRYLVQTATNSRYYIHCFHELGVYVKVPIDLPQPSESEEGWREGDFVKFDINTIQNMLNNPNFKLIPLF